MSNVHPFCVYWSKKSGKLHLFDAAKLNKCLSILKIRKDGDLTFSNVVLPEQPNNFQRYHSQCHNRFTALPPKQRGYDPKKQAYSSSSTDAVEGEHFATNDDVAEGVHDGTCEAAVQGEGEVAAEPENVDASDDVDGGEDAINPVDNTVDDDADVSEVAQEILTKIFHGSTSLSVIMTAIMSTMAMNPKKAKFKILAIHSRKVIRIYHPITAWTARCV
ncbi:uncharacterized protein [Eurosta solidaginis]|uniref:uncharacterized protein n=1 Tax=Eurosta solidaginis TaxID=178769 RepID=UPI0035312593